MIVDTHLHTAEFSTDSHLPIADAVARAREMGIDALCITDHNSLGPRRVVERWQRELDFKLFIGVEVLSDRGDIICYGLNEAPPTGIWTPDELMVWVRMGGGCAIAVHPFRRRRGLGDRVKTLPGLDGVECFNGCTSNEANLRALAAVRESERPLAILGGGDAHDVEDVGRFVTEFDGDLRDERDLIAAVRERCCRPLAWDGRRFVDAETYCTGHKAAV